MIAQLTRKLRGRSPDELRERASQAMAAWLERISAEGSGRPVDAQALNRVLAAGVARDPAALLAAFRERAGRAFFPSFIDPAGTVAALRAHQPADEHEVLARAERIHAGRFDLLGHRDLHFGNPIDWQLDPIAGRRAPRAHWSAIPYLDAAIVGDHKVVWELNRHQYFAALGQAYWYTGDERHAACFAAHVESWIAANPPKVGINWASSLEVSFRAMSWLWGLHFFARSRTLAPELYGRMLGVLHVHGLHLERYLSTYFSPNTHLTGEALGLVHLGLLLPELARSPRWLALGLRILEDQVRRQVYADGVYFEQATQYHRYTTEFYLHLVLLCERHDVALSDELRSTVERLLEHLLHLSRGDGTMPLLGDDDGGRLVQLDGRRPDDVRGLLGLGATRFARADLRFGARGDLALAGWIGGAKALATLATAAVEPPAERSRAFPHGGYYVMRDGWGERDAHVVLDCGPHGTMNCGHAHADALSFELWAQGRTVVADPGTFSYAGDTRDAFRSGAAHNVVTVDGEAMSEVGTTAFSWRTVARARRDQWAVSSCGDLFSGSVAPGVAANSAGAGSGAGVSHRDAASASLVHRRQLLFVRGAYLVLCDRLLSGSSHGATLHFQGGAGLVAARSGLQAVRFSDARSGAPALELVTPGAGALETGTGWVSPQYGARVPAPRVTLHAAPMPARGITTFLLLPGERGELPTVTELSCTGGRAFRVQRGDHSAECDWVLVRDPDASRLVTIDVGTELECDGTLAWLRTAGGAIAVMASDVSLLRVGGTTLLEQGERSSFYERGC